MFLHFLPSGQFVGKHAIGHSQLPSNQSDDSWVILDPYAPTSLLTMVDHHFIITTITSFYMMVSIMALVLSIIISPYHPLLNHCQWLDLLLHHLGAEIAQPFSPTLAAKDRWHHVTRVAADHWQLEAKIYAPRFEETGITEISARAIWAAEIEMQNCMPFCSFF